MHRCKKNSPTSLFNIHTEGHRLVKNESSLVNVSSQCFRRPRWCHPEEVSGSTSFVWANCQCRCLQSWRYDNSICFCPGHSFYFIIVFLSFCAIKKMNERRKEIVCSYFHSWKIINCFTISHLSAHELKSADCLISVQEENKTKDLFDVFFLSICLVW